MSMAKLLVPAGAPDQDSSGDTFSPTQFGFCAFLLETFFGIIWPSWNVADLSDICALATWLVAPSARASTAVASRVFMIMSILLDLYYDVRRFSLGREDRECYPTRIADQGRRPGLLDDPRRLILASAPRRLTTARSCSGVSAMLSSNRKIVKLFSSPGRPLKPFPSVRPAALVLDTA